MKAFIIVIDGLGVGALPDSKKYNDYGANTLGHIKEVYDLRLTNLENLGIFNIDTSNGDFVPEGAYGKIAELSKGKDTIVGHWEIAGLITKTLKPTFPNGFPTELVSKLESAFGTKVLCNKPYSGTEAIKDYGEQHLKTGYPILYTSADSVLQLATHTDIYSIEQLYQFCEKARELCIGKYEVARVIARPFSGSYPFVRTPDRRDYAVSPDSETLLDILKANNLEVVSIGKIDNIFSGKGITRSYHTIDNNDGLNRTVSMAKEDFNGLVFVNLVDTDMKCGHRRDVIAYAQALEQIDEKIGVLQNCMKKDDVLYITADHGCDPTHLLHTDHTREYTPLLVYGNDVLPTNLGIMSGMDTISDTVKEQFGLKHGPKSIWQKITQ